MCVCGGGWMRRDRQVNLGKSSRYSCCKASCKVAVKHCNQSIPGFPAAPARQPSQLQLPYTAPACPRHAGRVVVAKLQGCSHALSCLCCWLIRVAASAPAAPAATTIELVLVNPLMQAPPPSPAAAPPSPAAAAAAAGSPQHHHHYHNQQQQQSLSSSSLLPVDLAALSGLQSLRLLQVDVGLRGAVGGSAAEPLQPLQLMVTEDSLRQLAQVGSR